MIIFMHHASHAQNTDSWLFWPLAMGHHVFYNNVKQCSLKILLLVYSANSPPGQLIDHVWNKGMCIVLTVCIASVWEWNHWESSAVYPDCATRDRQTITCNVGTIVSLYVYWQRHPLHPAIYPVYMSPLSSRSTSSIILPNKYWVLRPSMA